MILYLVQAQPSWGLGIVNCPFHVVLGKTLVHTAELPVLDSGGAETVRGAPLLANFVHDSRPRQGLDSMESLNPVC